MYNNIWPPQHPDWMSSSYLENKRNNARILRDKGIANYRHVRGARHQPLRRRVLPDSMQRGDLQNIDVSKVMDRFIDILDAWVDKGTVPPPTHSDDPSLGDANTDGAIDHPALAFPEIACPLGVYYSYPETVSGATAFAAFTGKGIEPLNGKNVWVDMNRNGVWDYRETPTQAWRRLGLLQTTETLTREKYVACVQSAADQLRKEGFFSDKAAASSAGTRLQPRATTADAEGERSSADRTPCGSEPKADLRTSVIDERRNRAQRESASGETDQRRQREPLVYRRVALERPADQHALLDRVDRA